MSEYPALMFSANGEEVTVHSLAEQKVMAAAGYRLTQAVPAEPEPEPDADDEHPRKHQKKH